MGTAPLVPAALRARVLAGVFDFIVLVAVCAACFLVPLLTRGFALPMWGVLLAIIAYQVVPLVAFHQTLGMALFKLELVTLQGHAVDPGNVAFRELIGRGFFPAAFLLTVALGLVGQLLGVAAFAMPSGLLGVFWFASFGAFALAVFGAFLALQREDRRSLADVMTRSQVIALRAPPAPDDAEEREERSRARARRLRTVVALEVLLLGLAIALPWLLTQRTEGTFERAERLKQKRTAAQFEADPSNAALAAKVAEALQRDGQGALAQQVLERHRAALAIHEREREATLRAALAKSPTDEQAAAGLIRLLLSRQRRDEARAVYADWSEAVATPEALHGYATFLTENGWADEGASTLQLWLTSVPGDADAHALLARALVQAKELEAAQEALVSALLLAPEEEMALEAQAAVEAKLPPLPAERVAALQRQLVAALAEGVESHPRDVEARSQLRDALARSGRDREAQEQLVVLQALQPDEPELLQQLAALDKALKPVSSRRRAELLRALDAGTR